MSEKIEIVHYSNDFKKNWDNFIRSAKNGHFMFERDYMEYHSDRFIDFSLIFIKKNKIIGLLPANISNNIVHSHQGLTFGGIICNKDLKTTTMLEIFESMINHLENNQITEFIYKKAPRIYTQLPCDEEQYALFRNNFEFTRCDISSTIHYENRLKYSDSRKSIIKRGKDSGLAITYSENFKDFWTLLEETIHTRHGNKPTHSLEEISLLKSRFPNNIILSTAELNGNCIAGAVLFINNKVIHTQYLASSNFGRELGALDYLLDFNINKFEEQGYKYFDFGTSNEDAGKTLNEGLIFQKEGFGGRGISHEFYTKKFL